MMNPATIHHPPPPYIPPQNHLSPPQNHPPPPENHLAQNTLPAHTHHHNQYASTKNQFITNDLAKFMVQNALEQKKMAEKQIQQQQQLTHFISGFLSSSANPQLDHSSVSTDPALNNAESAFLMQKNDATAVHPSTQVDLHLQHLPQTKNTLSRMPEQVPSISTAQNHFSPFQTSHFGQNTCNVTVPVQDQFSSGRTSVQRPQHSPSSGIHAFNLIAKDTPVVCQENPSKNAENNDFSFNVQGQISQHSSDNTTLFKASENTISGIPDLQNSPIVTPQQNSLLPTGFSALTAQSDCVQCALPASASCVAAGAQGSRTALSQPFTSPITSSNTPPTILVSQTPISHTSSSKQTNSFVSLFNNSKSTAPLFLAPIPQHYIKGNLPAIKLDENTYLKSVQACNLNLIGRFSLPKGASPVTTSSLHSLLNGRWKIKNGFILTPIGKGYYCLRFKSHDDLNLAWLKGSLNFNPGIFKLQLWQNDFKPELQKQTTALIWIRLHGISQEYWDPQLLISIASLVGTPQAFDPNTKNLIFGHYARMKVEVDLLHPLHSKLLIEREGFSFEVLVTYENIPKFCAHCHFIGHLIGECKSLRRMQASSNVPSYSIEHPPSKQNKATQPTKTSLNVVKQKLNSDQKAAQSLEHSPVNVQTAATSHHQAQYTPVAISNPVSTSGIVIPHLHPEASTHHCHASQAHAHSPAATVVSCPAESCLTPPSPHNDQLPIHNPPSPLVVIVDSIQSHPSQAHNSAAPSHGSTDSSVVPCSFSSKKLTKSDKQKQLHHSCSFYKKTTPTPSTNRSLSASHNSFMIKQRLHNQFEPLTDLYLEGDGEGESWNLFGGSDAEDENSHYINEENLMAAPALNSIEALDWGTMADDDPIPTWEARADAAFEAAINGDKTHAAMAKMDANNACIQIEQDDRNPVLDQDFPPLQKQLLSPGTTHLASSDSKLCSTTNSSGSEYVPSPLKTRAQRKKSGTTVLPSHKPKKMSKVAIREANAVSRLAKPKPSLKNHDPDESQSISF